MEELIKYLNKNKCSYMGPNIGVSSYNEGFNHAIELIKKFGYGSVEKIVVEDPPRQVIFTEVDSKGRIIKEEIFGKRY